MQIILSHADGRPIYEQITGQVKGQILDGTLPVGEQLPSIRLLAKELRISVITTKRAYEELERDGFIQTIPGKGSFVAQANREVLQEERLRTAQDHLQQAVTVAASSGITLRQLVEILTELWNSTAGGHDK